MPNGGDLPPVDLTAIPKDCQCITHEGLHWVNMDRLWFEKNLRLLCAFNVRGFIAEEIQRLAEKRQNMARYVVNEKQRIIFPAGCSEGDYQKRVNRVLEERRVR